MTEPDKPSWLKRMENGTIGEATAREFLIDRFWILERSVDIHGADLIIQRRLSSQNILDKNPPRFGVIQVKYFQDENTTQYIPKEYILDQENKDRKEFFVLAVSGYEDSKKIYLLSARDIVDNFLIVSEEDKIHFNSYRLPGTKIFESSKFLIAHKKTALDKIENTLNLSSFSQNRFFISYIVPEINKEIDTPYIINIANDRADFRQWQNEIKEKIQRTVVQLDDTIEKLNKILIETDPLKIENIVEDIEYLDRQGSLYFKLDIDSSFFEEARNYKEKHDDLDKDGLLQNFVKAQEKLSEHILKDKISNKEVIDNEVYLITINCDKSLDNFYVSTKVDLISKVFPSSREKLYSGIINETEGCFTYYYVPNMHGYWKNESKGIETYKLKNWNEVLTRISQGKVPNDIMNKIYEDRYYEK